MRSYSKIEGCHPAKLSDLKAMSRLDKETFPQYSHVFSFESLEQWYKHNADIFLVTKNPNGKLTGFSAVVPISESLFHSITQGRFSSLSDFPASEVMSQGKSRYYHIEVVVTAGIRGSRYGLDLLRTISNQLVRHARFVTASPITPDGERLCRYFGFDMIGCDQTENVYPIYLLTVDPKSLLAKIAALERTGLAADDSSGRRGIAREKRRCREIGRFADSATQEKAGEVVLVHRLRQRCVIVAGLKNYLRSARDYPLLKAANKAKNGAPVVDEDRSRAVAGAQALVRISYESCRDRCRTQWIGRGILSC